MITAVQTTQEDMLITRFNSEGYPVYPAKLNGHFPTVKWREKLFEMSAWVDLQMIRLGATIESVLKEFVTCFTGSLRDWFDSLGPYRQLQFVQLPNVSSALAILHEQFIGEPFAVFEAARRDYLNMKCCYLNTKDLDFHYKRISIQSTSLMDSTITP